MIHPVTLQILDPANIVGILILVHEIQVKMKHNDIQSWLQVKQTY